MHKTKLGVTVGMLGAAIYFTGLIGGITAMILLAGYVLLSEENEWLRKSAVKAVLLFLLFEFLFVLVHLIPDVIGTIDDAVAIFKGSFSIAVLVKISTAVTSLLKLAEKLLFIGLGVKAINQGTIKVPVIDSLLNRHMQ